jgi:hypothetical protein
MPAAPKPQKTNVYADRVRFYVPLKAGSKTYNYVYDSPCDASQLAKLGAKPLGEVALPNVIYKANLPRPARGKTEDGVNSYVASGATLPKGCKVTKAARGFAVGADVENFNPSEAGLRGSIVVYVEVGGIKWAWRMPNYQMSALTAADLTKLGIKIPQKADNNELVFGASVPYPPRAYKKLADKTVSTFCSDSVSGGDGWTISTATLRLAVGSVATSLPT